MGMLTDVQSREASDYFDRHYGTPDSPFDRAYQGLEWHLARDPKAGKKINGDFRIYEQPGILWARTPTFWVIYTIERPKIIIHRIHHEDGLFSGSS